MSLNSRISRCGNTLVHDGRSRGVQLDNTDKLCLDGQRLLAVSGSYGKHRAIYRTEKDEFTRITQYRSLDNSSSWFKAELKNGAVRYYGADSDSRFTPSQQSDVLSWALTREEDRSAAKNSIIYDYRSFGNGEYHIEHIFYTGSGLVAGNRRITFGYDSSVRQDVSSSYIAGGLIRQTKRLKTISTYYGGQIVRQYRLDYEYSDATNRSLLASIEECGYLDSQPACMPATRFGWQDDAPRFVVEKLGYRTGGSEENYIENGEVGLVPILQSKKQIAQILPRGDVNGDGSVDWPTRYIDAEGMDRGVNNNTLSSHDVCSKNPISHKSDCIDVDFNLDGRTDGWGIENGRFKIAYTPGSWQSTAVPIGYYDSVSHVGDFNGDSWPDVVIRKSDAVQGNLAPNKYRAYLHLYLHTGNTSTPYTSSRQLIYTYGFSNQILTSVQYLGDMDGNGTQDFVALNDAISDTELTSGKFVPSQQPTPDTLYLTKLNASGGIFIRRVDLKAVLQRHSAYGSYQASRYFFHFFTDVNGDGLVDWISGVARGNELALNMGNGNFGSWAPLGAEASIEYRRFPLYDASVQETRWVNYPKYIASFRQFDYNGDGRQELLVPGRLQVEGCRTLFHDGVYKEFCGNELYGNQIVNPTTPWIVAPIDAGRMDDSIYQFDAIHFVENADGSFTAKRKSTPLVASATQNEGVDGFGNGLSDFLFSYGCQGSLVPAASCLNGSKSGVMASKVTGTYINRNRGSASGSERYAAPDMMTSVTDGLGYHNEWIYRPLSSNDSRFSNASQKYYEPDFGYLNQLDAAAKRSHFHFNSSMYVVAEHSTSNAVGGMNKRQYRYKGALFNKEGRGFQGFRSIINEDITAGVKIRSDFHQVFPLAGKLYKQRSWLIDEPENSASPFKESTHSWQIWPLGGRKTTINSTPGSWSVDSRKPYFVGSSSTSTIHRDLPLQSGFRTELYRNTQSSKFDLWGNLTETDTVYSERNNLHRVRSVTRTNFVAADDSNWWLNKPSGIVTIRTAVESRQGVAIDTGTDLDMSITVTFPSWDNVSRMPKQILTKPSSGKWRLSATEYNSFGMPTIVTESAEGESQSHWRTVKTDYSPDGYFVNRITNAKGHTKTSATFPEHGQLGWEKDANGLTTLFDYDEFGRLIGVLPPDQPATYTGYQRCDASCPENTAYRRVITQEGSPKILTFSDSTGRVIAKHKEGFDGRTIITSLEYNALGHKTFESAPAFDSVSSKGVRYLSYDAFGRLTKKQSDQANNQQLITTYSYSGFMTSITAGELTMSRSYNGLNQLINTIDALGGETQYAYDAAGNPIVIQDAYASRIIAKYDALGQKIRVSDPNMGATTITYTGFGDVSSESDANNQVTRYSYDQLSRKTDLFVDGIHQAHWDYDNAINGVGLLAYEERKDQNVKRVYEYDGLARVSTKTAIIGNESYIERNYYDSNYGRPKGLRYPSGLTLAYQYNDSGYLTEVTNAVSGYSYQKIEAINERGQWSESLLGGGVIETQRTYSDRNGQFLNVNLSSIGFRRQSLDYTYDLYGNLEAQEVNQRFSDSVTSNIEEYYYDDLHRLTTSSRADGVSTNYLYDAVGNFRKKDDFASTYHYEGAKPYAVSKVDLIAGGSIIYQYDSNGNRTHENAAQTVWYNTNNQPIKVARGGNVLNFFYDANYKRYKQVSVKSGETQTTQYVNKSFERIRTGVGASLMVEDRHYLGDFAIFIEKTVDNNTTNTLSYLHKDRLGSTVAILDDLGKFKEASSYDPFGKPRTGDMEDKSPAVLDSKLSTRGFTDHEHLDDVKLIHMNGRGYDYELGQFLSVDPIIVSPTNSQSMNPYSYILNNPLSGTDPTGYAAATCAEGESGSCATIVTREVSKIVTGSRIPQKFNVITKVSTNVGGSYRIEHSANGKSVQFSDKITSAGQIASQKERKNPSSMAYGNHPDFIKGYNRGEPNADLIVSLIPAVAAIEAAKALIGGVKTAIEDGGSLGNVATNIAAEVSTAVIATKLKGIKAAKSVHGNSKASTNQQHLYMIEDVDGNIKKIGVSGQKLNKNGSSRRANSQLKDGDRATVLESGIPGRAAVLQKEGQLVEGLKKVGHELPDNKRPKI